MKQLLAREETSEALHRRVRDFASGAGDGDEHFEDLALAIARFQAQSFSGFARLVDAQKSGLDTLASVPAVPVDAFRMMRVSVFPSENDVAEFRTSGTTSAALGRHFFRTLETYSELALKTGSWALRRSDEQRVTVVALAPPPAEPNHSSLAYMIALFMKAWDGRPLATSSFVVESPERWLLSAAGVDLIGLERATRIAQERQEPLVVLATSFALVHLLDELAGRTLALPKDSVVLQTGGLKGRSRIVNELELRADLARAFALQEEQIVGEYGMTELTSQFYEGTRRGAVWWGPRGEYIEPPWARVEAVEPETLELLPIGEVGIARITDLGNVDSAVVIQTQDLVRRGEVGVELFGRQVSAPARGCSLATEALLGAASGRTRIGKA